MSQRQGSPQQRLPPDDDTGGVRPDAVRSGNAIDAGKATADVVTLADHGTGAVHAEGPDNINSIFDRMARGEIEGRLALAFDDRL